MQGYPRFLIGLFLALSQTGGATAELFTTNGAETRLTVQPSVGDVYGRIGQISYIAHKTGGDEKPFPVKGAGGTAFLVSPCHALTNASVMAADLANLADGPFRVDHVELRLGPLPGKGAFRDRTTVRVIAAGAFERSAYIARPALGLAPQLEFRLAGGPLLKRANDWALIELETCLGDKYGYFRIDADGADRADGAGLKIQAAGYPLGEGGDLFVDRCVDMGPAIAADTSSRWSYSHRAVRHFECPSEPGDYGGPVFHYSALGEARVIGIATSGGNNTQNKLTIPREYAHEYFSAWKEGSRGAGYMDIRQVLLSPRAMKILRPYQPALRAFTESAVLRQYEENSIRVHDSESPEHLQATARADLPEGFLYLRLAHLNRRYGNLAEAENLERMAKEKLSGGDWRAALPVKTAHTDAAITAENLTLLVNAKNLLDIDRAAHFSHRAARFEWALRAGNLALAREDLKTMKEMEVEAPIDEKSSARILEYDGLIDPHSTRGRAIAPRTTNDAGGAALEALLISHGNATPHIVARTLQKNLRENPHSAGKLIFYTLDSVGFVARDDDFDRFWRFRFGRGMRAVSYRHEPSADLLSRGEYLSAITSANIELAINVSDTGAIYVKAQAQLKAGFVGASIKTYSALIAQLMSQSENRQYALTAAAYYQRGSAHDRMGRIDLALADFKMARQFAPGNHRYSRALQ